MKNILPIALLVIGLVVLAGVTLIMPVSQSTFSLRCFIFFSLLLGLGCIGSSVVLFIANGKYKY